MSSNIENMIKLADKMHKLAATTSDPSILRELAAIKQSLASLTAMMTKLSADMEALKTNAGIGQQVPSRSRKPEVADF